MMHPKLQERLQEKKERYERVTAFAESLPMFEKHIMDLELDGEYFFEFTKYYKGIYFAWGVNWYVNKPTNFPEERKYTSGVVSVYVNCNSLFGDKISEFAGKKLGQVTQEIKCYFYDNWNSTFYFKPDEVEEGLDKIVEWHNSVKEESAVFLKEQKRKELQEQLKALEEE